jgi:3-oxoacyl-[acyl-carrier protein] reductase
MGTNSEKRPEKVVIVTGAARGIGAATAIRLANDGFAVAVLDVEESSCAATVATIRTGGGTAIGVGADVTNAPAVDQAFTEVLTSLGEPTALVNNAGIVRDSLIFKMEEDEWDQVVAVHLRGAFLMSRAIHPHVVKARWGRVVNISSTSALGNRGQANYAAAKAGLQGLTKSLAIELGGFGVTVNCVAPGFIDTEMTRATAERIGKSFESFSDELVAKIPAGRPGTPEDVAASVSFFLRNDASFVSGQVMYVGGGPFS